MILNGWKEIADCLGRAVRTVQRWESLGLPVRRPNRRDRSAVIVFSHDLDEWLRSAPRRDKSGQDQSPTAKPRSGPFRTRILVVDDDETTLVTTANLLFREGHEVRTARDGFEALAVLRGNVPELLVSDLKLPNMSGFELLGIVRKKFPSMAVLAFSSEFAPVSSPVVVADRFLQKGKGSDKELIRVIRELLSESPLRTQPGRVVPAPTWIPKSTNGYVVMTCSECLRPFSVPIGHLELNRPANEKCLHCGQDVSYFIDSTVTPIDVHPPSALHDSNRRLQSGKAQIDTIIQTQQQPNKHR